MEGRREGKGASGAQGCRLAKEMVTPPSPLRSGGAAACSTSGSGGKGDPKGTFLLPPLPAPQMATRNTGPRVHLVPKSPGPFSRFKGGVTLGAGDGWAGQ